MAKLNINLQAGTIEVEGDDALAQKVYEDFKQQLLERQRLHTPPVHQNDVKKEEGALKIQKRIGKKESYTAVPDLDLVGRDGKPGLRDFYSQKKHKTAFQNNALFVYYLQKIKNLGKIQPDHIYTCYKDVGRKPPSAFRQSLFDTSNRTSWIDTSDMSDIRITMRGESAIEHDLNIPTDQKEINA